MPRCRTYIVRLVLVCRQAVAEEAENESHRGASESGEGAEGADDEMAGFSVAAEVLATGSLSHLCSSVEVREIEVSRWTLLETRE